jgi:hypothetical protein
LWLTVLDRRFGEEKDDKSASLQEDLQDDFNPFVVVKGDAGTIVVIARHESVPELDVSRKRGE